MKLEIKGTIIPDDYQRMFDHYQWSGTSPKKVKDFLGTIEDDSQEIEIYINSQGGYVFSGSEIYSALKEYKGKKTVKIVGLAASAASFIAMAGDEILMSPTGSMMIHNASSETYGDYSEMDKTSEMLQSIDEGIRNAYILKSGMTNESLKELMDKETWLNAQQAIEKKLVDGILFDEKNSLNPNQIVNSLGAPFGALENMYANWKNNEIKNTNEGENMDGKGKIIIEEPTNVAQTEPTKAVEMTAETLKNEHSAIYEEIFNLGINSERERIKNIEDLGVVGHEDLINKAKFEEPTNAEKLAVEIVKAQKNFSADMLKNFADDKKDIIVDNTANPGMLSNDEKSDETAKKIADMMNEGRK